MNDMRKLMEAINQIADAVAVDDRVWFQPHGVYPFTYDNSPSYPLGTKTSSQFPKNNRIEGTVIEISGIDNLATVNLDRPVRGTKNGKRQLIKFVYIPAKQLKLIEMIEEAQAANPRNQVTLDIPLMIRLLEFARDDAKTDQDLHSLTDNMINLSPDGDMLTMADYAELITGLAGNEENDIAYDPQPGDDEPLKHGWQA